MKRLLYVLLGAVPLLVGGAGCGNALAAGTGPQLTGEQVLQYLNGPATWVGTISATAGAPKDNTNTAAPFTLSVLHCYRWQCAAAAFVMPIAFGSFVDAQSETYQANQFGTVCFLNSTDTPVLAEDPVASTVACKVSRVGN